MVGSSANENRRHYVVPTAFWKSYEKIIHKNGPKKHSLVPCVPYQLLASFRMIEQTNPVPMNSFEGRNIKTLVYHGSPLTKDSVFSEAPRQSIGSYPIYSQIALCGDHCAGLSNEGEVFIWYTGGDGKRLVGHETNDCEELPMSVPTKLEGLSGEKVIKILPRQGVMVALTATGKVFQWGVQDHYVYELVKSHGHDFSKEFVPIHVKELADEVVVDISSKVAVTSSGFLINFSYTRDERILIEKLPFVLGGKTVISISQDYHHSAFVTADGELFTWGWSANGRLGNGIVRGCQPTPEIVKSLSGIRCKYVLCKRSHTTVLTENGRLYTFGNGDTGELGHGDKDDKYVPSLVLTLETKHIVQVSCGSYGYMMALTSTGFVYTS